MKDRLFDYLAYRPRMVLLGLCVLLAAVLLGGARWFLVSSVSPYTQHALPLVMRSGGGGEMQRKMHHAAQTRWRQEEHHANSDGS